VSFSGVTSICNDWKLRCVALCHLVMLYLSVTIGKCGVCLCNI